MTMERLSIFGLLLLLTISSLSYASTPDKKTTLVFAALPTETPEIVVREVRPMLDYLEEQLNITIRIDFSASHQELLDKFQNSQVDLAFLGALPYVSLKTMMPHTEPLVIFLEEDGNASYTCSLLAPTDSIKDPSALIGQPVALTNPLSTCGYLVTDYILNNVGLNLEQTGYSYLSRHDLVALAVARGEFASGGVKTSIGRKYLHLGLEIIAESEPVPGRPLIASGTMNASLKAELQRVLTTDMPLESTSNSPVVRSWYGPLLRYGAVIASDHDFDPLRRMLRDRVIPTQ